MLDSIRLQHFRSYDDESFELSSGVNIIVGPNASGKTNLLEAILVLCLGKSYRATDQDLVRFGADWARLDAHSEHSERIYKLEDAHQHLKKSFVINGQTVQRLTVNKMLPVVLFEPTHLQLLTTKPEQRRAYLDDLLEQTVAGYATLIRQYRRTLAQRNALLKTAPTNAQLFVWNVRLSELGGQLVTERLKLCERLNHDLSKLYTQLAGRKTRATVRYYSSCPVENYSTQLLHKLESHLEQDRARGFTSHGPHRDDLMVELNGHSLQEAASRGEARTLFLALKIIEVGIIESLRDKAPLLLLDDVFSELDGKRRQALTDFLQGYQTFITTTDADVVIQHFLNQCHVIPLG